MIGDVLFYTADRSNLTDDVIALYEGNINDYIHVAVQVSENQKIEATFPKIVLDGLDNRHVAQRYTPKASQEAIQAALQTLTGCVGQNYGMGDILDVLLHHPIFEAHTDCSDLATRYLYWCGDPAILAWNVNPHIVTPSALAYRLNLPNSNLVDNVEEETDDPHIVGIKQL